MDFYGERSYWNRNRSNRVVIIGAGMVGSTYAYALLISGLVSEIIVIDLNEERLMGEVMDLNHGVPFVRPVIVRAGDYGDCRDADLVVITAGAAQKVGETRLDLVHRNVLIFQDIVPKVVASGTHAPILVATNPVDVMTYVTLKLSGLPKDKVIGSGTVLDTARFRYLLSEHCQISPVNVHAYILGEHGDSEVPIWSLANIAGLRFTEYCPVCGKNCGPLAKEEIFEEVKNAAYKIIKGKGATYYAIGLGLVRITESILRNEYSVLTVSSLLEGEHGIYDVCLSIPTVVARDGIKKRIMLNLSPEEERKLKNSADVIKRVLREIKFVQD
ncbi:L-lactate dehydrogenase [Capillibacterium thermochitinicola]|uniref:L-lactate dehydrogenase n=1 Tax=Capillibacterium thermochitinicola TaxID=2699427 RepID=A0A8J6I035_9FIRM|nr:L-lactate dehydrogenase [Capillibacterium thermochitinicola]MBA2132503.1 L-lactate dehydrogenase [Capillibacterium thermochitinicola]